MSASHAITVGTITDGGRVHLARGTGTFCRIGNTKGPMRWLTG